jgi:outer membrane receptor for ferrienterochelin and colicin
MLLDMSLKIRILLFLFILTPLSSFSQVSVKGTLLEKGTRKPLGQVNVFLLPAKLKAVTDAEGKFLFPDVKDQAFEIIVNSSGYIKLQEKFKRTDESLELYLEKEFYDVFETVVTGVGIKKDVTKKSLSQKDFLKAPGAQEDPIKAVQNLPGVASQSFSSQIVIQGSAADDTRYTLEGHEIPLVFHFGGLTSVVVPTAVESVDYLSAGYGPEYGRALGGIINLNTRKPKTDRWHGEGFLDITKTGVLSEGPINDHSSLLLAGRISYFGKILEKAAEEMDDFAVTSAPEFNDLYLKYHHQISDSEELSLDLIRSKDTLAFIIKEGDDPNIEGNISNETTFYRFIPSYSKKIDDRNKYKLSLGYGEDNINFNIGDRYFDLETTTASQRFEWEHKYNKNLTQYFGIDSQLRNYRLQIRLPSFNSLGGINTSSGQDSIADIEGDYWETAGYIRNTYKYSDKLSFSPNLRLEYFSSVEKAYLMPRLNSTYTLSSSTELNFAYGRYYQAPQNGEASKEFGNPEIKSEKSDHFYLSVIKDFREGSNQGSLLDVGLFYKNLDDLIIQTSDKKSDGTPIRNTNGGTGTVYGMQLQGSYKKNEYTFLASYTYLKSLRKDDSGDEYPSEFDQTHNINLIGVLEKSRWSFSTRLRFVSGGPYTPISESIYNSDQDIYVPIRGDFFSKRYEDFVQLDFRIDRKFVYKLWLLSAYLDIQNITNNKNGQGISYNFDYSKSEAASGIPIFPIIGLRGEF